jgi:hypothetical protein
MPTFFLFQLFGDLVSIKIRTCVVLKRHESNIIGGTFFFNVYAIRVILIIHSVLFTAHRFIKSSLLEKEKNKT